MTTPKPSSAPDSFLAAELEREYKNWRTATRAYGFTYYFSRVSLIILTAVVAAKESLADSFAGGLTSSVPVLAVAAAILTAFDTWLKPQQKWRGFMQSRDRIADLRMKFEGGLDRDQVRRQFDSIRRAHKESNVF
ncbi:MAG: hypothetical protein IPJ14_19200 [Kineosporiaceae bacterium]|nr:hypothetical protein [Kineosporiaceae bacterium]MBK7624715.1 hypothetical protein [Kineosporiaceae bacterium]MBK8076908.1 hypothetical protein [Kineosporiaceae bacterium]